MPKKSLLRSQWPRVRKILHHGHVRFLVDCRPVGKRELWDNAPDALAAAERIDRQRRNDGAASFAELNPGDRRDAAEALSILPEGVTLLDAARAYVAESARQRAVATVPTVVEAIDQYLASKRAEMDKGEFARVSLYDLASKLRPVREALGERKVTELTEAIVTDFLAGLTLKPAGRLNVRTKLSQLLRYCMRRGWLATNPAEHVKVKIKQHEVQILDVAQVKRLLLAVSAADPVSGVLVYMAVQAFGGLRPSEAQRLQWQHIHLATSQLEVRSETSKTRQTRFVPIEPVLATILLAHQRAHGPIIGRNFERTVSEVRLAAGFGPGKWVKDVLRHTYGSFWLATYKDRAALCEHMGNSLAIIRRHYRKAIPEALAREYWSLSLEPAKVIPLPPETLTASNP
jgi:integrase